MRISRFKAFESLEGDLLDISKLKTGVDMMDFGPNYVFYKAVDMQQMQKILEIWPDIKLPLKHSKLLQMYIDRGYTFYFYVTPKKEEFLFFEVEPNNVCKLVHNHLWKLVKLEEISPEIKNMVNDFFTLELSDL